MAAEPDLQAEHYAAALEEQVRQLELRVLQAEERRRALLHIMGDLNESNRKLGDQRETTQEMEHREHELREKQEQLVQAGKLATLGELTTGVAHELNNPLNNIGLYLGNVIDQVELGQVDQERIVRDLQSAQEQVRKASEIISHLRTFGRDATVSVEPVDVNEVIERSLSFMYEQLRLQQIEVRLDLRAVPAIVSGNSIQIEQVFINLLTNARDALEESKRKCVEVNSVRDGELIRVTFRDTGPGIPEGLEQRIFDPFFTTKEVGAGTGLGLSITYGIVRDHGGNIFVESASGKGACFVLELPAGPEDAHGDALA